ncbi:MAG: hypothetical protein Fur0010_27100 [Bdellovibrio sp.]
MSDRNKKIASALLGLFAILGLYTQCVIEPPKSATPKKINATTQQSTATNTNSNSNVAPTPTPPPVPTTQPWPTVAPLPVAQTHFETQIVPLFQMNCSACHAPPVNNPALPGPLTIFTYSEMVRMLNNGTSRDNNQLMNKIRNISSHAGGNRCPGGLTDTVCNMVRGWYDAEHPNVTPPPNPANLPTGQITAITNLGKVTGWAADPDSLGTAVTVNFYVDGPAGTGVLIGSTTANLAGFNGGYSGNHAFQYYIPVSYRDGVTRQLYAAIPDTQGDISLSGMPMTFTAYASTVAGFNYYEGTLKPLLTNRCANCHTIGYDQHFASLLNPAPAVGGSATNNEMINMPSGRHGTKNHPGGNICGTKDGAPCAQIQTWWNLEFN